LKHLLSIIQNNVAAENIQRFSRNSALRPQHQQHNKVSNPKVVQHQLIRNT